jgi:hypothetical protein
MFNLVSAFQEEWDNVGSTRDDACGALVVPAALLDGVHQLGSDALALAVRKNCQGSDLCHPVVRN